MNLLPWIRKVLHLPGRTADGRVSRAVEVERRVEVTRQTLTRANRALAERDRLASYRRVTVKR